MRSKILLFILTKVLYQVLNPILYLQLVIFFLSTRLLFKSIQLIRTCHNYINSNYGSIGMLMN